MHVETVARLIELKPGSAERVRDWAAFINEHRQAAASESPIDAYHQQFKVDSWVRSAGAVGKVLVDLTADQAPGC
jgi:hypothetical protein